jgi:hypothetical protein
MQTVGAWPQFENSVFWLERVDAGEVHQHIFTTTITADGTPPSREVRVILPQGFVFDREESRKKDLEREKTQFQKAFVPEGFDLK